MGKIALVYADWSPSGQPEQVGTLRSSQVRNKEHFSFAYEHSWLQQPAAQQVDPDLQLFSGEQHSQHSKNFRSFLDSCPDRWGRMLMQRREAMQARKESRPAKALRNR